ncbi:hypothetical protein O3M35_003385 [Rhynocoris fuscipes]|uniref:Uncharacterized protein n=1 Tax=Rhynocoris fuscipes TaxID=488301 RepID=A0AAW1CPT3_9HEMI
MTNNLNNNDPSVKRTSLMRTRDIMNGLNEYLTNFEDHINSLNVHENENIESNVSSSSNNNQIKEEHLAMAREGENVNDLLGNIHRLKTKIETIENRLSTMDTSERNDDDDGN